MGKRIKCKEVTGAYDYKTYHNKNLNTPYSTYINKMPTYTTDWTWTKADGIIIGTANGINLGEGQFSFPSNGRPGKHQLCGILR
ncbi:hypothetical protein NXW47_25645 [Bacteroides thetaiotaomicron]|nr:hypothetical protein [Bacteroides thetaiotaomicron]